MNENYLGLKIKELRMRKAAREGKKITQKDLADIIGISRSYLGDIESGRIEPNLFVLSKIASALDVSVDVFEKETIKPIDKINNLVKENKINTIAAHFDGEEFTDEDLEDIEDFIKYVVSKRKNRV